jgi:ABC-type branched-subunit amino acid transport system substrate-binding protein
VLLGVLPALGGIGISGCGMITSASDYHVLPIDHSSIRIGMPTVLQGPSAQLGIEMKRGVDAWFKQVNAKGGIKGQRPLELDAVNDNYDPNGATAAIQQLLAIPQASFLPNNCTTANGPPDCVVNQADPLGSNHVLSILGQVGTPTMVVTAPVCIRDKIIYFGPFTGAQRFLRDSQTTADVIFNYRASYYEEAAAVVDYFFSNVSPPVVDFKHVIVFTQADSFGDTGYTGFNIAYGLKRTAIGQTDVKRVQYTRNTTDVTDAVNQTKDYLTSILATGTQPFSLGFFMVPSYAPAANFIHDVKDWIYSDKTRAARIQPIFMNVSFVGADALASQLATKGTLTDANTGQTRYYGDGVWVTQVVPSYNANLPGVVQYRQDLNASDSQAPTWGSLEGYLAAQLFTAGLDKTATYDTPTMIKAYESLKDFDLGIGPKVAFDNTLPEGHQASHTVWLSQLKYDSTTPTGAFSVPWLWKGPVSKDYQITAP